MRTSPSDVDTAFISHPIDKYPESDVERQVKTLPEVASRSSTGGQEIRLDWRVNQLTCSGHKKKDDIYSEHINGTKANWAVAGFSDSGISWFFYAARAGCR